MAIVTDAFDATLVRTVFVKPSDAARMRTPLPRALVNFTLSAEVLSAKPLNDTQDLHIRMTLDTSLAYRMVDMSFDLTQDTGQNWSSGAFLEITNAVKGLPSGTGQRHLVLLTNGIRIPTALQMKALNPQTQRLPRYIIQRNTGQLPVTLSPEITFFATNQSTVAAGVGTFNCLFSFLEYDIEQVEYYYLHYPLLTLDR